jgi:hypothetical protein
MFNKTKERLKFLEGRDNYNNLCFVQYDKILEENKKQINLLEKCDKYNTMYEEQADKRIKELEENLRLVYEYLGVHKEVVNDTFLVEDDNCCICDDCLADEDNWEDVKPKKKK